MTPQSDHRRPPPARRGGTRRRIRPDRRDGADRRTRRVRPGPSCPTPVAASTLPDSAPVHGLTVTKGTTPAPFTGTFEGVLQDGIAPGVDLILADLHSATIDKVGIWAGMSGSPVYDTHGALGRRGRPTRSAPAR